MSVEPFHASEMDVPVEPVVRRPSGLDGADVSPPGADVAGLRATSCPIALSRIPFALATLSPVAPELALTRSAPSDLTAPQPDFVETS